MYALDVGGSGNVSIYTIYPIRFQFNIYQCASDKFIFDLRSTLKYEYPSVGKVEILNTNNNPACQSTALYGTVTFNKSECGMAYEIPEIVLYTSTSVFMQMFNVTCRQDYTGVDIEHSVSEVSIEVDEIQNVFDSALFIYFDVVDASTDLTLTTATVGTPVKLKVAMLDEYVSNFNIRIEQCLLNGIPIYDENGPTTSLFGPFEETSEDHFESSFNLFRPNTNSISYQLEYECMVTTCLNACPPTGGEEFRKRRSAAVVSSLTVVKDHLLIPTPENRRDGGDI